MKLNHAILCTMLAVAPLAMAEEFSTTPKHETMAQAIAFEKYKIAAAEAQAKKDAAEAARNSQPAKSKSERAAKTTRKAGQADSATKDSATKK
jgi:hypothetical protein